MKSERGSFARSLAVTLAAFAVLFIVAFVLLDYIGTASEANQSDMISKAVRNAVLTCYAVEGRYPADVDYLKQNYGLAYDENRYIVSYDAFASNIMPEIWVSTKGAGGQ